MGREGSKLEAAAFLLGGNMPLRPPMVGWGLEASSPHIHPSMAVPVPQGWARLPTLATTTWRVGSLHHSGLAQPPIRRDCAIVCQVAALLTQIPWVWGAGDKLPLLSHAPRVALCISLGLSRAP